jgi:hypothetical protein
VGVAETLVNAEPGLPIVYELVVTVAHAGAAEMATAAPKLAMVSARVPASSLARLLPLGVFAEAIGSCI